MFLSSESINVYPSRPLYFEVTVFVYFVLNVFLYIYLVAWVGPAQFMPFVEGINALPLDPPMYTEKNKHRSPTRRYCSKTWQFLNHRPFSVFSHLLQWRGPGGWYDPPGDRPLIVVELREKKQSMRLDDISRLHILFLVLGQHFT